jgi:phytoene dehydrogenase-like protein
VSTSGSANVVVIGGGHNGLVCATLLARAGRQVTLLERRGFLGGLAAGEEFHPGFRSAGVHLDTAFFRPALAAELDLEHHGLRWREREAAVYAPDLAGGDPVVLYPDDVEATAGGLQTHSDSDGSAYRSWCSDVGRLGGFLRGVLDAPPPDVDSRTLGALWELGKKGLALRRLGQRDMAELLRVGPMCVADWLNERFATDRLKVLLAVSAITSAWTGPWSAGTALPLLVAQATRSRSVQGGPAALVDALTAAARAAGVTLRTDCEVQRLLIEDGVVKGVRLQDGEELEAGHVASSCDPKQLLLDLVSPRDLPPVLVRRGLAWRNRGTTAVVHLALDGPLHFTGCEKAVPDGLVERAILGTDIDSLERAFDPVKYGELPDRPCLEVSVPSVSSQGIAPMAPKGQHVVTIQAHFVPYGLAGGWNEDRRQELRECVLKTLACYAPDAPGRVLAAQVLTPYDLEQRYRLSGGHLQHGEHTLDQFLHLRPNPECARYATPLKGLWMCGSGSHPGGGVTGMPGALGARSML